MENTDLFGEIRSHAPHVWGSETSEAAAKSVEPHLGRMEAMVLKEITLAGDHGLTDDQIESITLLSHQSASARRRGLVLKGLVKDSGTRRKTRSGRSAVVWVVCDEPRAPQEKTLEQQRKQLLRKVTADLAKLDIYELRQISGFLKSRGWGYRT